MKRILFVLVIGMLLTVGGLIRANAGTAYITATSQTSGAYGTYNVIVSSLNDTTWNVSIYADKNQSPKPDNINNYVQIGFFNKANTPTNNAFGWGSVSPIITSVGSASTSSGTNSVGAGSWTTSRTNGGYYQALAPYGGAILGDGSNVFTGTITVSSPNDINTIGVRMSNSAVYAGFAPVVPENASWMLLLLGLLPLGLVLRSRNKGLKLSNPFSTA